ncbi:MAG: hypothetical protein HY801_12515 [Candidatus Lindowbacteria bacterium]|nr:hypothetical protein [Candidatus Lindowbacteria bacterium]
MSDLRTVNWCHAFVAFLVATTFFAVSCVTLDEGMQGSEEVFTKPKYVLTINDFVKYPRAQMNEKEVPTSDGRGIWINTNHFISSKSIQSLEPIPSKTSPGYYDLKLKLDRHGALSWMNLSVQSGYKPLALMIDDIYVRSIIIKQATTQEDTEVMIEGPFDKLFSEKLAKFAPLNYKFYHPQE